jgi:hypothetical protein
MVTNPIDELQMAFKPNTLIADRKYILQLTARRPNNVSGEFRYTMLMNDAPTGGQFERVALLKARFSLLIDGF